MKAYFLNVLIAIDQLIDAVLSGHPDHTISGRVGYYSYKGNKYAKVAEKVINFIFFWDEDHCFNSIEWDRVNNG